MNPVTREQRDEAIAHFKYEGTLVKDCPYGSGHINDTFLLIFEIAEMGRIKVILQRMNSTAFPKPIEVMENIKGVTSFLKKKIIELYHWLQARKMKKFLYQKTKLYFQVIFPTYGGRILFPVISAKKTKKFYVMLIGNMRII